MSRIARTVILVALVLSGIGAGADDAKPQRAAPDLSKLPPAVDRSVDFVREVQPIFAEHCIKCHGAKKQEGGLRLHARKDAFAGGDNGAIFEAGRSGESRMIHLVAGIEADAIMPPEGKGTRLTAEQVGVLRAWIDQGAKWPDSADVTGGGAKHWAYVRPVRHDPPAVKNAGWVRNPIDAFILARLEREGLSPASEADKATLIRRVTLDLTGLPPTPGDVEAFLADSSPNAFEKVVDRLLGSPAYGERWAGLWLDLARYADTHGYERDHLRTMWAWRDWVIDALNRDMPFDQFTIDQIAGDLLPNATNDQKLATGFHRNAMLNSEDGSDDEEWRVAAVVDRVNTTGAVWLGTTIGCAQCHSHKYDPFSMREYYQLFAYFNNTADGGNANKGTGPDLEVPVRVFDTTLRDKIAALEAKLAAPDATVDAAQVEWEKSAAGSAKWTVLSDGSFDSGSRSTGTKQADGSWLVDGAPVTKDVYTLKLKIADATKVTGLRLEVLPDPSLPGNGPGRAGSGNFVLTEISATATPAQGKAIKAVLQKPQADFSQDDWPIANSIDGKPATGWGIAPHTGKAHEAIWQTKADLVLVAGDTLVVVLEQNYGDKHTLGKFRIAVTDAPREKLTAPLPPAVRDSLAVAADKRSPEQRGELQTYYRGIAPELKSIRDELAKLQAGPKSAKVLVMQERKDARATHVMIRGNFQDKGDAVQPGVPEVLNALPPDAPKNRIALARWLVSPDNPLTGRVMANRLWEAYFGRGIVLTSEDFGLQGERPVHPELLDWMATEFVRRGWSLKAMHRLIVTSATYRQSSTVTPALLERDPHNRLHARGPRTRLEAEMIRDQALAIAGLLSHKMGGPPVMPPQPEGVWNRPYSGAKWTTSAGEDRYRRALYTFWRRTAPYPSMSTFGAPSREVCTVRRSHTNTPLQALVALNDPVYLEAAQGLARRVLANESLKGDEARVVYAFQLAVARKPTEREQSRLVELLQQELKHYRANAAAAKAMVSKTSAAPAPAGMDVSELAAWTVIGNVLLNLDETITKG